MEGDDQERDDVVLLAGRAALEMGVRQDEWRDVGERASMSLLLHVQVPAMGVLTGDRSATGGKNSVAIDSEVRILMSSGLGGRTGPLANAAILDLAAAWTPAAVSPALHVLTRPEGLLRRLMGKAAARTARTGL